MSNSRKRRGAFGAASKPGTTVEVPDDNGHPKTIRLTRRQRRSMRPRRSAFVDKMIRAHQAKGRVDAHR